MRLDVDKRGTLSVRDFDSVSDLSPKDAELLFQVFASQPKNGADVAHPDGIKQAILHMLKEKKNVVDLVTARSLIVEVIDQIVNGVAVMVCVIIFLVILLDVDVYTILVALGTACVTLGFALGSTLTGIFESLQMLFVTRPFEIGDIITVNDGPPVQVEKVSVIATACFSMDGFSINFPNADLAHSRIANWRRSKDVTLSIPLHLSLETRGDDLSMLQQRIEKYFGENPAFQPRYDLVVSDIQDQFITVTIRLTLKATWQDRPIWLKYSSDFTLFVTSIVVELGIRHQKTVVNKTA